MTRRFLAAMAVLLAVLPALPASAQPRAAHWVFDRLDRIAGLPVQVEGDPRIVATPLGKATQFDGVDDGLFVDTHPLAGAKTFTFEAWIRPDGGEFAQRWFHLESSGPPGTPSIETRILFELRVVGDQWYLDAFANGPGYARTLVAPTKLHPLGRWYHVAQTFDGTTYRSYVDGVLQDEGPLAFTPQPAGKSSIGVRINRVYHFKGAIRAAWFTPRALAPNRFHRLPKRLRARI
ncbi:LamG domain-containing protein [Sphingomonas sp. CJ20]